MHSLPLILIFISITTIRSSSFGQIDLTRVFKAHRAFSSYNFFLNRFVLITDNNKIETKLKLIRNLHLDLLNELDKQIQKRQKFNRIMTKEYQELKSDNTSDISSKLIYLAKKIQLSNRNYFSTLLELKSSYQKKLDKNFKSTFMTHTASQNYWKKILAEIFISIENIRLKRGLTIIIQNNKVHQNTNHFFSELDSQISYYSPPRLTDIMQNLNQFSQAFPSITDKFSVDRSIKIIPTPIDISEDVINEF